MSFDSQYRNLLESKRTDSDNYTHASIKGGKYCFDNIEDLTKLYDLSYELFNNGSLKLNLCERNNKPNKCIVVDFDFKYSITDDKRRYNDSIVSNIVKVYIEKILEYHDVENDNHKIAFIFEKKEPYVDTNKNEIKDGIHIVFPFIISNNLYQERIRDELIKDGKLKNIVDPIKCSNSIDDILDKAILYNGWMLYGHRKDDNKHPYLFTKILKYNENNNSIVELNEESFIKENKLSNNSKLSVKELTVLNSIRSPRVDEDCLINGITKIKKKIDKKVKKKKQLMNMESALSTNNLIVDKKFKFIKELVNILDRKRVENYPEWIKLGWVLRNINDNNLYLKLWIEKSKTIDKYINEAEQSCIKEWKDNSVSNRLTEGTLKMWAREDNYDEYAKIMKKDVRYLLNQCVKYSDCNVPMAKLLYEYYKGEYYCVGDKWFKFNTRFHIWQTMDKNIDFSNILSNEIFELFNSYQTDLKKQKDIELENLSNEDEDDDAFESLDDKKEKIQDRYENANNNINKLLRLLLKNHFKKSVIDECTNLFVYDNIFDNKVFEEILDTNNDLIVFTNGVYDLNNDVFRKGEPEDYLTVSTNLVYMDFVENNQLIKEVEEFLEQIIPIKRVRNYVMKSLASCLSGEVRDENAYFFTGEGGNGKSKLLELMKITLGELYISPPASILQQKRSSAESASPQLVSTKSKRIVVLQEPEETKLNAGMLKEWTGGDSITGRGLYEKKPISFKPQFKLFIVSNHLPQLPADDGGIWRRVKNIKFISTFTENPDPNKPHQYRIDKQLSNKLKKWPQAFMWILIKYYKLYIEEGLKEPPEVIEEINNYRNEYDTLQQWYDSYIEVTNDDSDFVRQNTAYTNYKDFCSNKCQLGHKKLADFNKFMNKKVGKIDNNKKWKGVKSKEE